MGQDLSQAHTLCNNPDNEECVEYPLIQAATIANGEVQPDWSLISDLGGVPVSNDLEVMIDVPPIPMDTLTLESAAAVFAVYEASNTHSRSSSVAPRLSSDFKEASAFGCVKSKSTSALDASTVGSGVSTPEPQCAEDDSSYCSDASSERSVWGFVKEPSPSKYSQVFHSKEWHRSAESHAGAFIDFACDASSASQWPPPPPSDTVGGSFHQSDVDMMTLPSRSFVEEPSFPEEVEIDLDALAAIDASCHLFEHGEQTESAAFEFLCQDANFCRVAHLEAKRLLSEQPTLGYIK